MRVVTDQPGAVLRVEGKLDVTTVADVRLVLHDAVDHGQGDLVIDLGGVELIDATGLGVLVGAHRRAMRCGRRVVLRAVPPRVLRLLTVTKLSRILTVDVAIAEAPVAVLA